MPVGIQNHMTVTGKGWGLVMGSPGVESLLVYSESRGCRSRCTPAGVAMDRQCWSVLASSVMSGIDDYGGSGLVSEKEEV